jgi:hypothetical protein
MLNMAIKLALASGVAASMAVEVNRDSNPPPHPGARRLGATAVPRQNDLTVMDRLGITPPLPKGLPDDRLAAQDLAAKNFAVEVVRLSAEADAVDRLWHVYKAECGVRVGRQYDYGREWFALWDRAAEPSVEARGCSEILWRLLRDGEGVRRDLTRARANAKDRLDPGTEVGMLRWHSLQWP